MSATTWKHWWTQIGIDAVSQVLKEFWPDIKHKLFHGPNPNPYRGRTLAANRHCQRVSRPSSWRAALLPVTARMRASILLASDLRRIFFSKSA